MSFTTVKEILEHYQLHYTVEEFIDLDSIPSVNIPDWFKEEIHFSWLIEERRTKKRLHQNLLLCQY